jgi:23S rRNA pseudouridine2605 synthase
VVDRELRAKLAGQNKIGALLSSTPEFNETQLGAARATAWKQTGEPLLTLEAARDWINERGVVLFAPRTLQLPAPAPSLVEATLGAAKAAPTMAETEVARGLVSRLVGEGLALPLNLMSVPGDTPDFVVSAQVFSYIFTMRGDKAWKLPPSTSGAVKVSPLGLRVFEVLTERGPMSASELAQELGREVTEAAILRSLSELWSQLRVIPLLSLDAGSTLWELTSRRFTKAIKAGANAGQPTALSALVSLYLAQVLMATEEEITTFLSPLTARSRVREVLHALVGARQLETVVIAGKTLLHIPGTLQQFGVVAADETPAEEGEAVVAERPKKIGTGRIKSFTSEAKSASEFRGKPAGRGFSAGRAGAGRASVGPVKPSARFGPRLDGKTDPERRPFKKSGAAGDAPRGARPGGGASKSFEKKSFSKPWNEDRKPRAETKPDGFTKFRKPAPEDREPLKPREQAGLPVEKRTAPKSSFDRASGPFAKRPYTLRATEGGARASFKPRSYERPSGERGAKPGGFGAKRPYTPRATDGGEKPFTKRPYTPRAAENGERSSSFAKRPYTPRTGEGGEGGSFKPRSFAASGEGKERGAKAGGFGAKRPYTPRSSSPRSSEGAAKTFAKRPYTPRASEGGVRSFGKRPTAPRTSDGGEATESSVERTLPKRPYKPRAADADKRPFTKAPWVPKTEGEGAKRPFKPRAGSGPRKSFGGKPKFGGKPGGFGAKRSGAAGGAKTFARKKPESKE